MTRAERLARAETVWEYVRDHPGCHVREITHALRLADPATRLTLEKLYYQRRIERLERKDTLPRRFAYYVVAGERPKE